MSAMIIAGLQLLIVIVARKVSLMKSMLTLPLLLLLLLLLVPNMIVMAEIVMMLIRVMMMTTMVLADAGHGRLDTFSADAYAQLFMVVAETMMTGRKRSSRKRRMVLVSTRAGAKCSASSGSVLVDLTATTTSWHRA